MSFLQRVVVGVVVVGAVIGFKFFNKSSTHDEVLERTRASCAGRKPCLAVVAHDFDRCFEENYWMGNKRQAATFNEEGFGGCMNLKATVKTKSLKKTGKSAKAPAH